MFAVFGLSFFFFVIFFCCFAFVPFACYFGVFVLFVEVVAVLEVCCHHFEV